MRLSLILRKFPSHNPNFHHQIPTSINPRQLSPLHTLPQSPNAEKISPPSHAIPSNTFFSVLDSCTDLIPLKKTHSLLIVYGLASYLPCQTKLSSLYASLGFIQCARKVFDRISNRDLYCWKVMFRSYTQNDCYAEINDLYIEMRLHVNEHDDIIMAMVLKACVEMRDLNVGMKFHCQLIKAGNRDSFVLDVLIDLYVKCGEIKCARRLFDGVLDRNVVTWTSIISGYVQNFHPEKGLLLFNEMRETNAKPSQHTIGSLLRACSMLELLHQGKWAHGYMIKDGTDMNSFIGITLLDMYVKCGEVDDARAVFDELCDVDLVSWTAMIVGYSQNGYPKEAMKLFVHEKWAKLIPNSVTVASLLSACGQLENTSFGRSLHALVVKLELEGYDVIQNALVDMYAKCGGIQEARCIFDNIAEKSVVTWNALIAGYSRSFCYYEALSLFQKMILEGFLPDSITVVNTLSACATLGDFNIGTSFHAFAAKCGFLYNIYVSTALINLYNKSGDVVSASKIFNEMKDKSVVTWCAMIGGHALQGESESSVDLLCDMLDSWIKPNEATFTSILCACGHSGMVDEGKQLFHFMTEKYKIIPKMKHYACMVDILARSGKLEEAFEFIESMPVRAEAGVWAALLHGCTLHSRSDLGDVAVKRMMGLQLETADYYVLICNFYASDGRWDETMKIRELMRKMGLIKSPGYSVGIHSKSQFTFLHHTSNVLRKSLTNEAYSFG